jgi:hypothetical protein
MPKSNNTRRNSNKTRRSSNGTRRHNLMAGNNLFQQMMRGEVMWGDILANKPASPATRASSKPSPVYNIAYNALANYNVPNLTLRKGIWENFPVVVNELPEEDGTQRYEIKWDRKKMEAWRSEAPYNIAMEYEAMMEHRLIHSLRQFPHKYRLERPRSKNQVVIIAMVHAEGAPAAAPRTPAAAAPAAAAPAVAAPRLVRLNDIKEHFPVVWHEVAGRVGTKTYEIELFGKKVREMSTAAGRNLSADIRMQLVRALEASPSWIVLPAAGAGAGAGAGPIRIEMRARA